MAKLRNIKTIKKNHKRSENNLVRIILISTIVLSLGIMIGVISYTLYSVNTYNNKIISYNVLDSYVEVVNYNVLGLNGDKDAVRFGRITAGNRGVRFINISSKEKAIVSIYVAGEMANFISVEKNNFEMEKGTSLLIPINLDIPSNTSSGNYSGKIYIKLTRP